jgi:hypothetical protein
MADEKPTAEILNIESRLRERAAAEEKESIDSMGDIFVSRFDEAWQAAEQKGGCVSADDFLRVYNILKAAISLLEDSGMERLQIIRNFSLILTLAVGGDVGGPVQTIS